MGNSQYIELLKKDIHEWNQWRLQNTSGRIHLDKADLSNTNLSNASLENTNFNFANLSNSDLSNSFLWYSKFEFANLDRVNFTNSRLEYSYLKNASLNFAIFVNSKVFNANLKCSQLKFSNFQNADLTNSQLVLSDLEGANLSYSDFSFANLKGANLTKTNLICSNLKHAQLLDSSLKRANLTGACIEDWHINVETDLEGIICEYVYLKWDDKTNSSTDRRPSDPNRTFAPGEFAKLFQIAHETVDLFFREGIDWQAFLASYQDIRCENKYGELDIRAIEKSSDGSLVIRVEVPRETNKAELESQFYKRYESELKQLEGFYQQQLQVKDTEIESYRRENANMTEIAKLLASKPIIVEAKAVAEGNVQQSGNFGIGVNEGKVQGGIRCGNMRGSCRANTRDFSGESSVGFCQL